MESLQTSSGALKELHTDLRRKFQVHGRRAREIWLSFDRNQRTEAVKAGSAEGSVLRNATDRSLGNVFKVIPEWNIQDLTEPGSPFLLELLEHRATKSLPEQYLYGFNGRPGDAEFIFNSERVNNLHHTQSFERCFTIFMEEEGYGKSFRIKDPSDVEETMAKMSPAVRAGLLVPQSTGELILQRQTYFMTLLSVVIDDILDIGSTSRDTKKRMPKDTTAAQTALSTLSIDDKPKALSVQDILATAQDYKTAVADYFSLLCNEPTVLTHDLNLWVFSQPELVRDEKGRVLPLVTGRFISSSFFDMVQSNLINIAIWDFVCALLQLIQKSEGKGHKATILQHISNVCHFEFVRAQKFFKRHVQSGSGSKHFQRIANVYDDDVARVTAKGNPDNLIRDNVQLSYMLRLCHPSTNPSKAVGLIKKLDDLHRSHPLERDKMQERELDALSHLVIITSFIESLSTSLSLPPINHGKGQLFISRAKALAAELVVFKPKLDLTKFASVIDNLLEPGMAEAALQALDQLVVEDAGTRMAFLYEDLVEECVSDIKTQYQQQQDALKADRNVPSSFTAPSEPAVLDRQAIAELRREKEKTRPAHSSFYEVLPRFESAPPTTPEVESPVLTVKQTTFSTFSVLFSKSEAQGSVNWTAFETAMTDIGFSIIPKFGSVFTFVPPEGGSFKKSITLHRPHGSRIERHTLRIFASRLKRVYGWRAESFQVS